MKNLLRFLTLTIIFVTSLAVAQANDFTDAKKALQVNPSSTLVTLKLKSNPTTGYSWFLVKYNESIMSPISHKYYAPTSQLVGAPGYEVWQFRVWVRG